MDRHATKYLQQWMDTAKRKPLVLRGARQVGKTWMVRDLAQRNSRDLIEINFERNPSMSQCFESNDPQIVLKQIAVETQRVGGIDPQTSFLFLDEVQAFPEALAKLRWFYEEMPDLPVVAAGSLLEFTLANFEYSMPVGRISFQNVEPLGFDEYLQAHKKKPLYDEIQAWRAASAITPVTPIVHKQATQMYARYIMVGGMPEIVCADIEGENSSVIRELQEDLLASYRADFSKYNGRINESIIDQMLSVSAQTIGQKFVAARAGGGLNPVQARAGLRLLTQAHLCTMITHTAATGIPLASERKNKFQKIALLDIGMMHALVNTPSRIAFPDVETLTPAARNRIAEQMTTQSIRRLGSPSGDPRALFYWVHEGGSGRSGEIDYIIELNGMVVPLELKSGASGSMKSLHLFMHKRKLSFAIRVDGNPPSIMQVNVKTTEGNAVSYTLLSIPLYLLWNIEKIVENFSHNDSE